LRGGKAGFHLSNFARLSRKEQFAYLSKKLKGVWDRESEKAAIQFSNVRRKVRSRGESEEFGVYVEKINGRAYFTYTAEVYPGKVTVFQPQRNYAYLTDSKNGWGDLVLGGLEFVRLPVDPGGIFIQPYVQTQAGELKARIDEAARLEKQPESQASTTIAESVLV
jgi:hypothetical protein